MLRSPMAALWRNREFVLLQLGQLLSSAGTSSTTIAYPLLALALTHSPAKAGIISFARLIPYALFGLVAGLAADRWNRKRLRLAALRTPFQETRELDRSRLRSQLAEGFRFLWRHRFIRTMAILYGLGNFVLPGVFLIVIVVGRRQGLSGGEIGGLFAIFGAVLLLGPLPSRLFRRTFSTRAIMPLEVWAAFGFAVF